MEVKFWFPLPVSEGTSPQDYLPLPVGKGRGESISPQGFLPLPVGEGRGEGISPLVYLPFPVGERRVESTSPQVFSLSPWVSAGLRAPARRFSPSARGREPV
ncbi:hypothetical protein A8A57_02565 [Lelliottia amnigena]|nr:hypothetical protein A8A57_02565 [Lelliottia amnigena]